MNKQRYGTLLNTVSVFKTREKYKPALTNSSRTNKIFSG